MGGQLAEGLTNIQKEGEKRPNRKAFLSSNRKGKDLAGVLHGPLERLRISAKVFICSVKLVTTESGRSVPNRAMKKLTFRAVG